MTERFGVTATRQRRNRLLPLFEQYVVEVEQGSSLSALAHANDSLRISQLLADYGQALFSAHQSRSGYSETINAVQRKFPHLHHHLALAWDVDKTWHRLEPSKPRAAWTPVLVRAMTALCFRWQAPKLGVGIMLGYEGCLRPNDIAQLRRHDVRFPSENGTLPVELGGDPALYLTLRFGKTRFSPGCAVVQHARIADSSIIQLAWQLWGAASPDEFLIPLGGPLRRAERLSGYVRFLLEFLKVPASEDRGFVLAGLRAGGITQLFRRCGDLALVEWRARWVGSSSLAHYLQELESLTTYAEMPQAVRDDLEYLSNRLPSLISS